MGESAYQARGDYERACVFGRRVFLYDFYGDRVHPSPASRDGAS